MLSTRNLKAGDVLDGRYRLERRVGGGGMGDVWEATDTTLWRTVAVKILLADLVDDRGFRERFRREARAIALMKGPGIVEVYDYGEIDHGEAQIAYLIMEFIDGKPLSRLLGLWGRLPPDDAMRIVGGVAEALQAAHSAGIVHRDIKPGNILVRDDGTVVLVDFGIARAGHNLTLTTTGVVLGTVTYMSPEQAAGENLTTASDLYSLGVVAHQCLAGSPPFKADTPLGVLSAHLRNAPPPLPADVPRDVVAIVTRALQKDPSARWPDAAAFAGACRQVRAALTEDGATPTTLVQRERPVETGPDALPSASPALVDLGTVAPPERPATPRRRRMWAAVGGTLAALVTAAAVTWASPWSDGLGARPLPSGQLEGGNTQVRSQDGGTIPAEEADIEPGSTSAPSSRSETSASERSERDRAEPTATSRGLEPSAGATGTASPTASPSPTEEQTVAVPDVTGQSEPNARQRVEEAGLSPEVAYTGDGDHRCGVVRQSPPGGSSVQPESTVELTVERAADAESCKNESEQTKAPDGE
ncbi:hypothetical protein GCM10027447_32710 [Glycomyces halotolerans]